MVLEHENLPNDALYKHNTDYHINPKYLDILPYVSQNTKKEHFMTC